MSESTSVSAPGSLVVTSRERNGRAVLGVAVPRPVYNTNLIAFPFYGPWGSWYPWYGNGFGWNLGFVTYNPWYYGATRWTWGRYGMWYDPYIYDPYPFYGAGAGYSSGGRRETKYKETTGSIRLRVSPGDAQVYVDGGLVGTVDEFDGFSEHLELDGGRHILELRADGYETYRGTMTVEVGKTLTKRVSLKKIK